MGRAAAVIMASVLLSRILGFARDALIAFLHGANPETDAYIAAFTIPDFLNQLLAGGVLSIPFIPIFSKFLAEEKEDEGFRAFSNIATVMGTAMLVLIMLGWLFAEEIMRAFAPGFSPEQIAISAKLTRIILPAQFFFCIGVLLIAIQHSRKQFFIPALSGLIYNIGIIAGGLLGGRSHGMVGFAWGVVAGAFVGNFALQLYGAKRGGLVFRPRFDLSCPTLWEFIRLAIPLMLGFTFFFWDGVAVRWFGSFLAAGAITWLNNARRLLMAPVGILGQAAGVASYPFLTELAAKDRKKEMWETLSTTLRWVFLVSSWVGAIVFVLSPESIFLVFQRGAFGMEDTLMTASALSAFAIGIPLWCSQGIVARGFFAMKKTWLPTIVGTVSWIVALPIYYVLHKTHGVFGLGLATTIGISIYAVVLYGMLMQRTVGKDGLADLAEYTKMGFSAVLAAAAGTYVMQMVGQFIPLGSFFDALARLAIGCALITAVYFLACYLLGCRTVRMIRRKEDLLRPPSKVTGTMETEKSGTGDQ
jgi:putative peptidoglycan lipid II flippase